MTKLATIHSIVRNEDRWAWFALAPWQDTGLPIFVINDHSTDQTEKVLLALGLKYTTSQNTPVTTLRNNMIAQTKTPWFILVDGDEVWDQGTIKKFLKHLSTVSPKVVGVFLETRNCVGDVWHYLPQGAGKYEIAGKRGHLNIRAYRKAPGLLWQEEYPLEHYGDINTSAEKLSFFPGYYWHMTHLQRSSKADYVAGFRRRAIEEGIAVKENELPEVFWEPRPDFIPNPLLRRSVAFELAAKIATPLKHLKRSL